jgi:spectinomycin phosphotransferase
MLYPFVRARAPLVAVLTDDQWREFGSALRDVHASALGERLRGWLPVEIFSLPSAALVLRFMGLVHEISFGGAAARLAEFWREHAGRIRWMLTRAEALGSSLRTRPFEYALCPADLRAANILLGDDGRLHLIDWDGPLVAAPLG